MSDDANPTAAVPSPAGEASLFPGHAPPRRYREFTLPVSGLAVRARSLTELERSQWEAQTVAKRGTGLVAARLQDAQRRLIVLCLVDQAGNRILNNSHVARIGTEWDAADAQYAYDEISKHVGLRSDDLEELVKNSGEIPVD